MLPSSAVSTGFRLEFKKRTGGDKLDGCALLVRESAFSVQEVATVEYMQPGCRALDRDNVGIVARLRWVTVADVRRRCLCATGAVPGAVNQDLSRGEALGGGAR